MFHRILLPVDLSDRHGAALRTAAELARPSGGEIILLHVIEQIAGIDAAEERPFYERLERAALAHLKRLGAELDRLGAHWHLDVRVGSRLDETCRRARDSGADLVVMTTPAPTPDAPLAGLGSLGFRVSLLAPCPVLLVR